MTPNPALPTKLSCLFVHQNFPGQFKFLAPTLAANPANRIMALAMKGARPRPEGPIKYCEYSLSRGSTPGVHPWVGDLETKVVRAEAALAAAVKLRATGFNPDVIIAHPGWGDSLFLKEVWPKARLGMYCEFFYHARGADVGFDPEFEQSGIEMACRLRLKNLNQEMHIAQAHAGLSPTQWQRSTYPEPFRSSISVIHDGIDTTRLHPNAQATLQLPDGGSLSRADEVITFVNRNLEPYRGYHIFMRALPEILRRHPKARVVIVGAEKTGYGAKAPDGKTWKQIFLHEVSAELDLSRIHFVGNIPYPQFVSLLQVSTVHVYLTYPFVLSWSLMEAMSCGCAIVASDTAPLKEMITHGQTGLLTDFFDFRALADKVSELLADPEQRNSLGAAAREFVASRHDLRRHCLPRQLEWVTKLAA